MLRVVLDTNVLVSAIISDGKPRELFRKGIENQFLIMYLRPHAQGAPRVFRQTKIQNQAQLKSAE